MLPIQFFVRYRSEGFPVVSPARHFPKSSRSWTRANFVVIFVVFVVVFVMVGDEGVQENRRQRLVSLLTLAVVSTPGCLQCAAHPRTCIVSVKFRSRASDRDMWFIVRLRRATRRKKMTRGNSVRSTTA